MASRGGEERNPLSQRYKIVMAARHPCAGTAPLWAQEDVVSVEQWRVRDGDDPRWAPAEFTGLPLRIAAELTSEESTKTSSRFISDAIVEAGNAQREIFSFDRTRDISSRSAQEIAQAARAWGQTDDITVVTVKRHS
jgi:hypothetical protein